MNTVTSVEKFIKILNLEDEIVIVQFKDVAKVLIRFMKREKMEDKIKEVLYISPLENHETILDVPCTDMTMDRSDEATYFLVKFPGDAHLEALNALEEWGVKNLLFIDYEVFASISQSENFHIDFMCCGFVECGTSFLDNALQKNNRVFLPKGKENLYIHWRNRYENAPEIFREQYFSSADENQLCGNIESSYYASARDVYECFGPDVKILFMVRQPSAATYSYFKRLMHRPQSKRYVEFYKKYKKCSLEMFSKYIEELIYSGEKDNFCYDKWIEEYLEYFSIEQIKVVVFEELIKEPTKILSEIQDFIGVKKPITYMDLPLWHEDNLVSRNYLSASLNYYYGMYIRDRKAPKAKKLRFRQRKFYDFVKWAQRYTSIEYNEKMSPELRNDLDDFYRPYVENLEKITGRTFKDVWKM